MAWTSLYKVVFGLTSWKDTTERDSRSWPINTTHPALRDRQAFSAVPERADLPFSVTPSIQASPPQTVTAHTWNVNHNSAMDFTSFLQLLCGIWHQNVSRFFFVLEVAKQVNQTSCSTSPNNLCSLFLGAPQRFGSDPVTPHLTCEKRSSLMHLYYGLVGWSVSSCAGSLRCMLWREWWLLWQMELEICTGLFSCLCSSHSHIHVNTPLLITQAHSFYCPWHPVR